MTRPEFGNEPAFPTPEFPGTLTTPGMTLREYAAIHMMAAAASSPQPRDGKVEAEIAVQWVDDLFAELNKEPARKDTTP